MTKLKTTRRLFMTAATVSVVGLGQLGFGSSAWAADLKGGTLRVAITNDMTNYDPQQFSTVNFFLIKNLYDSLIEYSAEGEAMPSLATEWTIAEDNTSVSLKLRDDVTFHSGTPFDANALTATLEKAADPERGKNVYSTMSIVKDWTVDGDHALTISFIRPIPERQITDLLQFLLPIDPAAMDSLETMEGGTGAFMLGERQVGQSVTLVRNPNYWRADQPILDELQFTIFSEDAAAASALESGSVDLIYGGQSRSAVRLRNSGFNVLQGPGKLVQVFRINSTKAPFDNKQYRQAFNYLMNRAAILKVGYAGLGEVTALPWAPANPAFDASYTEKYAYNIDKAKELLAASGLSAEEMSNWKLLVNGSDEASTAISQVVQGSLKDAGIDIELDVRQGAEFIDALLTGGFHAVFGGVGNVQKFPSRVATNSIYRTAKNPVFGDPHPHPAYVEAIAKVDSSFGEDVQPAYDNLNAVLVDEAFAIPTNSYETGLIVASPKLDGFTLDIDNLFVGRTVGFK
ncbi:ABC transporter substrate-binding protein [Frigidibacter sp. ROC022]|uniref:ABC transporter substrate-binding protein n=1 Tax=Frigidibacter sp. ROC022 TaxID=2971796 RepID=UPI00215B70C5|nr:ABC transporter substrate-binding protein [Frigidibacter sp. ROC022]MCR8726047.1 ABC transporter substrate-binding protein [Frigidibacter sp. ROC022]